MEMPGGASLSAPNSATQLPRRPSYLITIPREIRDKIYSFCNFSTPPQCRKCSAIEYVGIKYEHKSDTLQPFEHAAKLGKYKTFSWPYIYRPCRVYGMKHHGIYHCGFASRTTFLWINRISGAQVHHKTYLSKFRSHHEWYTSKRQKNHDKIPALAQVNQQLRAEVLSTILSTCRIYATVFDAEIDGAAILQKIKAIGIESAAKIKQLTILYSKEKDLKYIMTSLMHELKLAGVNTTGNVVEVMRWTQKKTVPKQRKLVYGSDLKEKIVAMPGCQCEYCVVQFLREKDREARATQDKKKKQAQS